VFLRYQKIGWIPKDWVEIPYWVIDFYSRGAWNSRIHVYTDENILTMILKNYQHYSYFSIQVWRHFTHVYLSIDLSCFTPACSPCEVRIVL